MAYFYDRIAKRPETDWIAVYSTPRFMCR